MYVEINFTGYDENEGISEIVKFYAVNLSAALERIAFYAERPSFEIVSITIKNAE